MNLTTNKEGAIITTQTNKVYKVSAVSNAIKQVLEGNPYLQDIIMLGEISNFKPNRSGHLYFSLKDEEAVIDVVMYKWHAEHMKFDPENGMKVFLKGNVSFYGKGGRLQFIAQKMALDGVGNLHQQYEALKRKLHEEGLFDTRTKKKIPVFPKHIGVVTSQTGAAVRDIITTIRRRYPIAKISLYPVVVQGEKAAPSIVKAIRHFNESLPVDTLIVGRGGGSIEDLWAFNEESVARAIFASEIPIISAVGHETDTTIADFVADVRAATPTGAAEIATPYTVSELDKQNQKTKEKMTQQLKRKLQQEKEWKDKLHKSLLYRHPERKLGEMVQSKDRMAERLISAMNQKQERLRGSFTKTSLRLSVHNPLQRASRLKQQNEHLQALLVMRMKQKTNMLSQGLKQKMIQLDGLSPLKIMSKGYSLTYKDNHVVKGVKELRENDVVTVKMADGSYAATITEIERGTNHE